MMWSKLKKKIEDNICDKLKKRITVFSTKYSMWHDEYGRSSLMLDNKEILIASEVKHWKEYKKAREGLLKTGKYTKPSIVHGSTADQVAERIVYKRGIFSDGDFRKSLWNYLSMSIDRALASDNVIIKALAIVDKRAGKRRLKKLNIKDDDHELIKKFYKLRCEAEGL
jgi:hypothetical protein